MRQKKGKTNRGRKLTALLLSAAMALSFVPGAVYGSAVDGDVAQDVLGDGGDDSQGEEEVGTVSEVDLSKAKVEVSVSAGFESVSIVSAGDKDGITKALEEQFINNKTVTINEKQISEDDDIEVKFELDYEQLTTKKDAKNVKATVSSISESNSVLLNGESYTGSQEVSTNATIYLETYAFDSVSVKVEVEDPKQVSVNNEEDAALKAENFQVKSVSIDGVALSREETIGKGIDVKFALDGEVTEERNNNVSATVSINDNESVVLEKNGKAYSGSTTVGTDASVYRQKEAPSDPELISLSKDNVTIKVEPEAISVNSVSEAAEKLKSDFIPTEVRIGDITLKSTELQAHGISVEFKQNGEVTEDKTKRNVDAVVSISDGNPLVSGGKSYSGSTTLPGVATIYLKEQTEEEQPAPELISLNKDNVTIKVEPEAISVNSANEAQQALTSFNAAEISINGTTISGGAISENHITVTFAVSENAVTADKSNKNVEAVVSISGCTEEIGGKIYSGSTTVSQAAAIYLKEQPLQEADVQVKVEPEAISVNSVNEAQQALTSFNAAEISINGTTISGDAISENHITVTFAVSENAVTADKDNKNVEAVVSISGCTEEIGGKIYSGSTTVSQAAAIYMKEAEPSEHQHKWTYKQQGSGVLATCSGNQGVCEAGAEILLTLDITKESDYTESLPDSRVKILANGKELDLESVGITYEIIYYKDASGKPGSVISDKSKPLDAGTYHVKVTFGNDPGSASITDTFVINKVVKTSGLTVQMKTYNYADSAAAGPSLSGTTKTKTLVYYYYKGSAKDPYKQQNSSDKFKSTSLDVGTYYVSAQYTQTSNENYIYVTGKTKFQVKKGVRSDVKVKKIGPYDLKGKTPSPQLNKTIEKDATITYYYSKKNKAANGTKWTKKEPGAGTWYLYAVIKKTGNYKRYVTPTRKFTVYADHKCSNMPKLKGKAQSKTVRCIYCKKNVKVKLPPKTVSVVMGKSKTLKSKGCTFTLKKSAKISKKYFNITKKTGKITTKALSSVYSSLPLSVPVTVKACGKTYTMRVKLEIPEPKVDIQYSPVVVGSTPGYRFDFSYNILDADRIEVRMAEGETDAIRRYLDTYISSPKSTNTSFIQLSNYTLNALNNNVTFKITAFYGTKKSKTFTKLVEVK